MCISGVPIQSIFISSMSFFTFLVHSLKRFKDSENLPIHMTISQLPLLARFEQIESPEEHIVTSLCEVVSQRILEILDSIGCSQRFSVKQSFVHFCVSDKSIL